MRPWTATLGLLIFSCTPTNQAPTAPTVSITPHDPDTTRNLQVFIVNGSTDVDSEELSYLYEWEVDGLIREGQSDDNLPSSETAKGETWVVFVRASDGQSNSSAGMGLTIIANSLPSAELSLGPESPSASDDLVADISISDADEEETSYTLSWTKNGEATDYTEDSIPAEATLKGETWAVTVVPTDGEDEGEAVSAEISIGNNPPVIDSLSLSPDEIYEESVVEVLASASDEDGEEVSLSYQWMVDGKEVLSGEIDTLSGEYFDKGQEIQVRASASDGSEEVTLDSEVVVVLNTVPEMVSVELSPSSVGTDDTLSATASATDADGDSLSYAYAWYVEGSLVSETGSSLDGSSEFDKGDEIYVVLTPSDSTGDGDPMSSDSVLVGNTAPEAPLIAIDPSSPVEGADDLLCEVETDSSDADGDAIGYAMSWTVDGAAFTDTETTTYDDDTVPADQTTEGDIWVCAAVPDDGDDFGDAGEDEVEILGPDVVTDFSIEDVNKTSTTFGAPVSPRDYLEQVSGWYFGHAT